MIPLLAAIAVAASMTIQPTELRCEGWRDPLGIDIARPRLTWNLIGNSRDERQSAIRVLVSRSRESLRPGAADLWDSGRVASDDSLGHLYAGKPLASSDQAFWKVQVWDGAGHESGWSKPAEFTMGVLRSADWRGKWIGAKSPSETLVLARRFEVAEGLKRALVHVCGLGEYEMELNGGRVSEDLLGPGWTNYRRTCLYNTYDVTRELRAGMNSAKLLLGNGMYNVHPGRYTKFTGTFGPLKAIAQIELEYKDGRREFIATDSEWRTHPGPITFASVYGGEDLDRRLEPVRWEKEFASWPNAEVVEGPGGELKGLSASAPPIRAHEHLKPVKVTEIKPGVEVLDFGQNVSLMPGGGGHGPKGSHIRMIPAELLNEDGTVDRQSVGGGQAYWNYILAGHKLESYSSNFFYHGARYLQVERTSPPGKPLPTLGIEADAVYSDSEPVGDLKTSDPLFNRIAELVKWAQKSNMMSVLTDCPHRERLGWLEQTHLNGPSLRYNFDISHLFAKAMNDMADSQLPNGLVPDIAPEYVVFDGGFRDSPEWGSAFIVGAWQQYVWTGDKELLARYFERMKRYVDYLTSRSTGGIVSHGLGDWYDIGPNPPGYAQLTPIPFTATAFYYEDSRIVAQIAKLLGIQADADKYGAQAESVKAAMNAKWFDREKGSYATKSQTANAMALSMNLVPAEGRADVLRALVRDLESRDYALTSGDVGYRYLLRALAENGRSDVIYRMNHQSDRPGYGYQLAHGATALTEAWDGLKSSSQNHFMLGQIVEWFYHDLVGIQPREDGPGFRKVDIRPSLLKDVQSASGTLRTVRGTISVAWVHGQASDEVHVTIPVGCEANVYLPSSSASAVSEGNAEIRLAAGVREVRFDDGVCKAKIGSGSYVFKITK